MQSINFKYVTATAVAIYLIVGSTLGIINPGGESSVTVTPPRLISAPTLVVPTSIPETVPSAGGEITVQVVGATITKVQSFDDYLDEQFIEANGDALLDMVFAGEAGEEVRANFIPTLTNPISPGFTDESALADRWITPEEFRLLLQAANWPEEELDQAYRVARCESPATLSGGPFGWLDILAVGPGFERGLFQIHPVWFAPEAAIEAGMNRALFEDFDLFDPFHNMLAALVLWRNGGWSHWECFNQGLAN